MIVHKFRDAGNGVHVNLGGETPAPSSCIILDGGIDEVVDGLDRMVGISRVGEQQQEFVCTGDVLIDGHLLPLARPERQEITDVLAEIQFDEQRGKDDGEHDEGYPPDAPFPLEKVIDVRYLHCACSTSASISAYREM